jgi:hypothetical protein
VRYRTLAVVGDRPVREANGQAGIEHEETLAATGLILDSKNLARGITLPAANCALVPMRCR